MEQQPKKLLDQVSDILRLRHYSVRTERACEASIPAGRGFRDAKSQRVWSLLSAPASAMGAEAGTRRPGF